LIKKGEEIMVLETIRIPPMQIFIEISNNKNPHERRPETDYTIHDIHVVN
jgi:hypothetical protein